MYRHEGKEQNIGQLEYQHIHNIDIIEKQICYFGSIYFKKIRRKGHFYITGIKYPFVITDFIFRLNAVRCNALCPFRTVEYSYLVISLKEPQALFFKC
jgi:hypothetical protein